MSLYVQYFELLISYYYFSTYVYNHISNMPWLFLLTIEDSHVKKNFFFLHTHMHGPSNHWPVHIHLHKTYISQYVPSFHRRFTLTVSWGVWHYSNKMLLTFIPMELLIKFDYLWNTWRNVSHSMQITCKSALKILQQSWSPYHIGLEEKLYKEELQKLFCLKQI